MDVEKKVLEKLKMARQLRPCTLKISIGEDDKIENVLLKPEGKETRILYIRIS